MSKLEKLSVRTIGRIDLRLVAGAIGDRADQADSAVLQIFRQFRQPAARHNSVVVE